MRGALPRVAFKQLRHRIQQEREEQASRLGRIEPSLGGASGGLPLTEGVPGARLQQESRDLPHLMGSRDGAVEDGRERGGRRSRVVLDEPQRRHSGANTRPFAFLAGRLGQDGIGLRGLPQPHEDVEEERAHLRRQWVRGTERPSRQAPGGTKSG